MSLNVEETVRTPSEWLAELRVCGPDPEVLCSLLVSMRGQLAGASAASQYEWHVWLRELLQRGLQADHESLAHELAWTAAELGLWTQAARIFSNLLTPSMSASTRREVGWNLGVVLWQGAQYRQAVSSLAQSRVADGSPGLGILLNQVEMCSAECEARIGAPFLQLPDYAPWVASSGGFALKATILGQHHALALYRLQRHAGLARLAAVEQLTSIAHTEAWIAEHIMDDLLLALLHPDYGLIGVAALIGRGTCAGAVASDNARFYYWIGAGYQGNGYGTQALALLRHAARHTGIVHLFSLVDHYNLASQRVLEKMGGTHVACRDERVPAGQRFYHYGCRSDPSLSEQKLLNLLDAHDLEAGIHVRY